jgi:hypothetical protein
MLTAVNLHYLVLAGKLATLQALLEDEEGCSRLSPRTLLAIAK